KKVDARKFWKNHRYVSNFCNSCRCCFYTWIWLSQINSGLTYLFNAPDNFMTKMIILIVATGLFILSAWSGLGKGIKILSTTNMWIAAALVLTLFIVGPSVYILDMFTTSIGKYVGNFFEMSFELR